MAQPELPPSSSPWLNLCCIVSDCGRPRRGMPSSSSSVSLTPVKFNFNRIVSYDWPSPANKHLFQHLNRAGGLSKLNPQTLSVSVGGQCETGLISGWPVTELKSFLVWIMEISKSHEDPLQQKPSPMTHNIYICTHKSHWRPCPLIILIVRVNCPIELRWITILASNGTDFITIFPFGKLNYYYYYLRGLRNGSWQHSVPLTLVPPSMPSIY